MVEEYRGSMEIAVGKLLAQPSWILEAPVVLMHLRPPELDAFVRLQEQGAPLEEADAQCLAEQGQATGHPRQSGRAHRPLPDGRCQGTPGAAGVDSMARPRQRLPSGV